MVLKRFLHLARLFKKFFVDRVHKTRGHKTWAGKGGESKVDGLKRRESLNCPLMIAAREQILLISRDVVAGKTVHS